MTGSTGKLTFEVYYKLLWNAAYQHGLNKSAGQAQRKASISHQVDHFDQSDHEFGEDNLKDSEEDDPSPYSVFQCSFNSTEPKKPTKVFIPYQLLGDFPEVAKQMIIDYNKRSMWQIPDHTSMVATTNQNLLWDNLTQSLDKFLFMKMTIFLIILPQKLLLKPWYMSVYLMVEWTHLILTMSYQLSKAMAGNPPQESSRKINTHQRYVFAGANQSTNHLVDRGANGGIASADMRVLQKTDRKINIVGIDYCDLIVWIW